MRILFSDVSLRRLCRVLGFSRSACYSYKNDEESECIRIDPLIESKIKTLISVHPTFGYRRIWALLRYREGLSINKKAVYRVLKLKGWMVNQRIKTPRPRVKSSRSRSDESNKRWAMDITHILAGKDGWAHLVAVIDCHDREVVVLISAGFVTRKPRLLPEIRYSASSALNDGVGWPKLKPSHA